MKEDLPKCNCGKEVKYMIVRDGEEFNSCNKHMVCPTYQELSERVAELNHELFLYRSAIEGFRKIWKSVEE